MAGAVDKKPESPAHEEKSAGSSSAQSQKKSGDEEPIVNQASLDQLFELEDDDGSFVQSVVTMYFEDGKKSIEGLETHLANNDVKNLGDRAHSLKGSSGYTGLQRLVTVCMKIQKTCENDDISEEEKLSQCTPLVEQARRHFVQGRDALCDILKMDKATIDPMTESLSEEAPLHTPSTPLPVPSSPLPPSEPAVESS
eukprot:TRINITY_DN1244_c0_g1::TRINITY_DN1244_c0_g1_i1::g.26782::m.26782 TRINITY_DN1244_c0_g1::TRINITY_DN1244_c0_g1_i1::g.26782  ORF type:complete len:209 (+),score=34.91,sp/O94321/MPR1_SCHPO/37.80/4e-10,Hpt/PF01627.18/5.8e-13,OspD/PF03207.8/0.12 TRINITY_DN1244_c0_g1_i1:38-628(+)